MWIQIRAMDGSKNVRIDDLSKLTKIEELRERVRDSFDAEPERQRLFYRGKQLEDGHSLFDYDVGLNDIIQLMIKPLVTFNPTTCNGTAHNGTFDSAQNGTSDSAHNGTSDSAHNGTSDSAHNGTSDSAHNGTSDSAHTGTSDTVHNGTSDTVHNGTDKESDDEGNEMDTTELVNDDENGHIGIYKVGEKVDARDLSMGAWFEAQVVKVTEESNETPSSSVQSETTMFYHVKFDDYDDEEIAKLTSSDVRPRARYRMQWEQLAIGHKVMVNYNPDNPKERGFWYDAEITRKNNEKRELFGKLVLGNKTDASQEVKVKFVDEVFRIETGCSTQYENGEGETRKKKPDCDWCKDNPRRKCKHCACSICGGKDSPDKQILCDECDMAYHLWCLSPALEAIPDDDEWYCPGCKTDTNEVIGAGEKLRLSKKKANMMSKKQDCNRDWGKGMACVGRTKMCTIVPSNHFGPIPGVPVGSMWKFRVQVSESGVHRPHVAGIHGRENEGAYSIVLSGGYEDDVDDGNEFTYSGSGGRDLSGNKRTAKQSMDQKLTAMNRALARNCDAPIDDKKGATAKDWIKGKPIRVVRNHKGSKSSKYAPLEGNRYDGIYKVVKYWPEKNNSGFIVWKYLMRRDDTTPAPWTSDGKKLTKRLGLTMQYPDGYLEAQQAKKEKDEESFVEDEGKNKKGKKRKSSMMDDGATPKKSKQPRYQLNKEQRALIKADTANKKVWDDILATTRSQGSAGLLDRIQEAFLCIVCQEVVFQPITTTCSHNICKNCLVRSFKADVYSCPNCRYQLGKDYDMTINKPLQNALLELFPGYNGGR